MRATTVERHRGLQALIDDLAAEGERLYEQLATLAVDEWSPPPAAPGWAIQDCVVHVASADEAKVAARALGVGRAALEDSLRYAQQRHSFGKPIWHHQSIGNYLADISTKLEAARQLVRYAARQYDSGQRADLEAGMAKLFASETAMEIALNAVRIHGGYGYSTEFDAERYFRDAPLMIVGEGTNEIQRTVITRQLIKRHGIGR
jgi:alkylation response protein AidB-like acyl-CoA dehydrogenase